MKRTLGYLISLVALGFVASYLYKGISHFEGTLVSFNAGYFILACLFAVLSYLARYKGWNALCLSKGYRLSYTTTTVHLASSEIIRYIPGNVWGFGARIIKAKKLGINYQDGTWLLIHESLLLLYVASFLILLGILTIGLQTPAHLILGILFVVVCFSIIFIKPILEFLSLFVKKILKQEFSLGSSAPFAFLKISPYYFLYWVFFGLGHVFLAFSLFDKAQNYFVLLFTWSLVSWAIGYFSLITPSGLGVRELSLTLGLAPALTSTLASSFSIFSRVWYTSWELIMFFIFKILQKRKYGIETAK